MKAVCHIYSQWDQIADSMEAEARHLLDLGLITDTTFDLSRTVRYGDVLRRISAAGGLCAPNIYPQSLDPDCTDANWWKYSEEQCVALLEKAGRRFAELDLGPMLAVNTYTPGNTFVTACRRLGVRHILGFCAPTVIEDGGWEISHYGSPLSPYFVSDEDYRKPAAGGRGDSVLISSMELRNPLVCLNHWSEGPWCPLNAQAADRWLEPSADPLPFLQIAEDWLRQSELADRPLFFHVNLQYFFAGRCREHNRRAIEWLAEQRDRGRLEVVGLREWGRRLAASGGFERQTTYWRGEMMGFHVGHRPGRFPDVVVDEHLGAQTVWQRPEALPARRYDYGKRWDYPAFQPDGSAPASDTFRDVRLAIGNQPVEGGTGKLTLSLTNDGPGRRMPILLWDAFGNGAGPFEASCAEAGWTTRIVPHPSGLGAALLVEGEVLHGPSRVEFLVTAGGTSRLRHSRSWGDLVCAETFFWQGRPVTYLVTQTPEPFAVEVCVDHRESGAEPVVVESLIGLQHRREPLRETRIALRFDGTRLACWHRLWGVTADEIELVGVEETVSRLRRETATKAALLSPDMNVPAPGYQTFGNIRDVSRWDRTLARAAGDAELRELGAWFRTQRPGCDDIVIEAHPGIDLPRGSITKVLGHEFDRTHCSEGYGFRELCADYPQGWDWGVSAWVQWRHLKLELRGLRGDHGPFLLHLHACDPESRDIAQRVHLFNPAAEKSRSRHNGFPVHQSEEICVVNEWILPRGTEGRREPSAMCSIRIPDACLDWPSIGVWIVPLEKGRLHDWITEQGSPGLLSHLWVSRLV